jgi:eukaryotic translation initiation factor 2C
MIPFSLQLLIFSKTNARLLQNPEVQYDKAKVNPGTTGRWDLRGKKFLFGNPEPLKSWGVVVIGGCVDEPTVRNFLQIFIQTYVGHGGKVENKNPVVCMGKQGEDLGDLVAAARTKTGNQSQSLPQILFFILPSRDSFVYERLKKNMECRFAMVSQSKFHPPFEYISLNVRSDEHRPRQESAAPILLQPLHESQR